jgi:four helix bundle protein
MRDFRQVKVWQKAHDLALEVYRETSGFPASERFGLVQQMRRAAVSVAANIAEGCGHDSSAELLRFLHIAMGSASELDYHLLLAHDLHFISTDHYRQLEGAVTEVKRMLNPFIARVAASRSRSASASG